MNKKERIDSMIKKIISITLVLITFFTMSTNVFATYTSNNSIHPGEETFAEYDVSTGETTYFSISKSSNGTTCTWDYFSETKIQQMQNSLMNFARVNDLNTRAIIGTDDRYYTPPTNAPYCAVVYLRAYYDTNGDGIADGLPHPGTGFLVSDKVMVTAAHCMIPRDSSTLVELRIYVGLDAETPEEFQQCLYIHPRSWTYNTNWLSTENYYTDYDYCVVKLWDSQELSYYFNCAVSSNISTPLNIHVSGYRGNDPEWYLRTGDGSLSYSDYYICHYDNDTGAGVSGGPVYTNSYCIGIHTKTYGTYNGGNLITQVLYNLICSAIADTT